jgi:hypothetical protein
VRKTSAMVLRIRSQVVVGATLAVVAWMGQPAVGSAASSVQPGPIGLLDCNGFSPIQQTIKPTFACADPRIVKGQRFEDNGRYIGHDEPSVRFVSNRPGSSADFTMTEKFPIEPAVRPTVENPGSDVTHFFELSVAPWLSMSLCDQNSFPQNPCTPKRDANAPNGSFAGGGGAFLELQFYPPGFAPFVDSISCDNSHWCSALVIWSLECNQAGVCNDNCIEPGNFAFVQTDGVPTGPPSPQLSNLASATPNKHTLLINPGDTVRIHVFDAAIPGGHALETLEQDLTTGQSGFMIASGANGFMHTSINDCSGTPFNFEPMYSSARAQNILPWGAGPYNVNSEFEIGHFEPCTRVQQRSTLTFETFSDAYYNNCISPYERTTAPDKGSSTEPNDSPCYKAGDTHGGTADPNLVTGCDVFFGAIGDLDYDGTPYWPDWPDATQPDRYPSTFLQRQPTSLGHRYESIQFVTDTSATQPGCDLITGAGCTLPAQGAPGNFYPYWTLASVGDQCVWEFGQMQNGNTFGGLAQYGSVTPDTLGAFAGPIRSNPSCSNNEG